MSFLLLVLLLVAGGGQTGADRTTVGGAPERQRPCKDHPEVRPPCFTVRGRLSYWSGAPTARIWVVGTRRMLGVSDSRALPGFEQMPTAVRAQLTVNVDLFGDYEFCPFTADRPGVMRLGCIQSARRLRPKDRQ